MQANNTATSYGSVARAFHWLTALLIFTVFPLGLYAESLPYATSQELAFKAQIFSIHKTLGIATFFTALARILWALSQTSPVPLHPGRRLETLAAETVHYALYLSLVLVPLSGWISHAAAEGFAPILWPFGDNLPFIPKSLAIEQFSAAVHLIAIWVLAASVALHVAGALKHVVIDRDATLARMVKGASAGAPSPRHSALLPKLAALAVYAVVLFAAWQLSQTGPAAAPQPLAPAGETAQSPDAGSDASAEASAALWQVESGSISLGISQMGSTVSGSLPNFTAAIRFEEEAGANGTYGDVRVEIDMTTAAIGSVSDQAKGADFFDVAAHPRAVFAADIRKEGEAWLAEGSLTIRDQSVPVSLPFTLEISGDTAVMAGKVTLDRRDFKMGQSYGDESTVGFGVEVTVDLTARRPG